MPNSQRKTLDEVNATIPGQPVFDIGETGPVAFRATCPRCGTVWDVTPRRDCFWPECDHYGKPGDTTLHPDGTVHVCCESCGLQHALTCRPEETR